MPVFIKSHPSKCLNRVNLVCKIRKPKLLKEVQAMKGKGCHLPCPTAPYRLFQRAGYPTERLTPPRWRQKANQADSEPGIVLTQSSYTRSQTFNKNVAGLNSEPNGYVYVRRHLCLLGRTFGDLLHPPRVSN